MIKTRKTKKYYQSIGDAQSGRAMGQWSIDSEVWLIYAGIVVAMFGVFGLMLFLACRDAM